MAFKKKDDLVFTEENQINVENTQPAIMFYNFDDFFMYYAKTHNIKQEWKEPVKLHIQTMGFLDTPEKWEFCCKHFGI